MPRSNDTVRLQRVDGFGVLDNFTSITITNDMTAPSEVSVELGDDHTYASLTDKIAIGSQYKAFVNNKLRMTGRIEADDVPADAGGGSVTRFVIRTKLADAMFDTAEPKTRVKNVSIRDMLLAVYSKLDYTERDFVFDAYVSRDLLTGRVSVGQGGKTRFDLEPIKIDAAKVQTGETIYDFADRHLRRHGLMHWDSPDGRIVVGEPNDVQAPIYFLRYRRTGLTSLNNVLNATRARDWSGIPSAVVVHGRSGKPGRPKQRITGWAMDPDVYDAGFYRPVIIEASGIRKQALADRAAMRELSARSKNKDSVVFVSDGLSFWDGLRGIEWGIDTTCSVDSDVANLNGSAFYIHKIVLKRDARNGDVANVFAIRRGVWLL